MSSLKRIAMSFAIFAASLGHLAFAGVGTSSGGHVIACDARGAGSMDPARGTPTTVLLDIYEAEKVYNLTLRAPRDSFRAELEALASRLQIALEEKPGLPHPMTADTLLEWWENRVQFIPELHAETTDLGVIPKIPAGCTVRQIAIYDDAHDLIRVSLDLWESLDDFNKAALIAHELIYRERRQFDREASSEHSRFLVGRIFSTQSISNSQTMIDDYKRLH